MKPFLKGTLALGVLFYSQFVFAQKTMFKANININFQQPGGANTPVRPIKPIVIPIVIEATVAGNTATITGCASQQSPMTASLCSAMGGTFDGPPNPVNVSNPTLMCLNVKGGCPTGMTFDGTFTANGKPNCVTPPPPVPCPLNPALVATDPACTITSCSAEDPINRTVFSSVVLTTPCAWCMLGYCGACNISANYCNYSTTNGYDAAGNPIVVGTSTGGCGVANLNWPGANAATGYPAPGQQCIPNTFGCDSSGNFISWTRSSGSPWCLTFGGFGP